jgi:hypothetical protein
LISLPMLIHVLGRWTMAVESFKDRDSIDVRNWD